MKLIDADTHVIECDHTWDFLEPDEQRYRPVAISVDNPSEQSIRFQGDTPRKAVGKFWGMEGRFFLRGGGDKSLSQEILTLEDVEGRLRMMDDMGVEVQVLFPTSMLTPPSERPEIQVALCKSYNRWLADACARSNGRLRWVLLPPLMSMADSLSELEFGKKNGACGVFMRGIEGNRMVHDPYFDPLYQKASDLDLAISIHSGNGNISMRYTLFGDMISVIGDSFYATTTPVVAAFHGFITAGLPERFPNLRVGFLETGAQWIPFALQEAARRELRMGTSGHVADKSTAMKEKRMFVACQSDEDIAYIVKWAGEDNLVIGTDFGHADSASEMNALQRLRDSGTVASGILDKIVGDNARALYGL